MSDNETTTKTPGPLTNAKSVQFHIPLSGGGWVVDHLCLYNNGQYVDAGDSGWWEVIPVAANSPQPAYGFRSGNVYMAGSMVDVPQRNTAISLTNDFSQAFIGTATLDAGGNSFTVKRLGGSDYLTMDTQGTLGRFDPPGGSPYYQHFTVEGNIAKDDRPYHWLTCGTVVMGCDDDGMSDNHTQADVPLKAFTRALDDRQLWRVDSISGNVGVIANRLNGRVLGINTAGQLVAQYPDGSASQQWQMIDGLGFSNVATQQIFSLGANNAITLAPMPSPWPPPQGSPPPAPSLLWGAMAYLSTPDLSTNELDHFVGQFFHLDSMLQDVAPSALAITRGADRSLSLAQCQMSGTPSRTQAFTAARDLVLNYDDTGTEYALAVVQNGSTNMVTLLPTAAGLSPAQQAMAAWILNTDGLFIHSQTGLLLTGNATTGLSLTPYDALFPASQNWQPMFVQGGSTSAHRLLSQTSLGDTPHPQLVVTKLVVDIELGNDLLDGTDHKVTMSFNGADYQDVNYQGFWTGYHWFRGKTFTIDCSAWDQVRNLVFEDLQQLFLKIDQGSWWTPDDSCYIENITLTVNDVYRVKRHTGFWLKSSQSIFIKQHEWGEIDPANPSQPGKPFDWSGKVYPVGLIPWIGDIRSWRTYDSSTIDGVGILLGVRNGQLVGNQMKAGMCEILGPNTPGNSYTWVFAPNGAIIYKKWDHTVDKTQYTRHSQLNYGNPVICAGEFLLKSGGGGQPWAVVPDTFIAEVNDASGHYKPEGGDCLRYVQDQLTALGVDTTNVEWRWREG